jgi:electron transport complex protein RnfC
VVRRLRALARYRPLRVVALNDKFPQCHPVLLTKVLLDREIPPGGSPLDVGALVLPLATLVALANARAGRPWTARVVTVAGDAVEEPGNWLVPFGTPIRSLLDAVGLRRRPVAVLAGGPMTGVPLPDDAAVVTPDVAGLTLLSRLPPEEPTTCIRCGWCIEDCPVGLDPRTLSQLELRTEFDPARRDELAVCIECGLCSYVCPSRLPLREAIARTRRRVAPFADAATTPGGPAAQ